MRILTLKPRIPRLRSGLVPRTGCQCTETRDAGLQRSADAWTHHELRVGDLGSRVFAVDGFGLQGIKSKPVAKRANPVRSKFHA